MLTLGVDASLPMLSVALLTETSLLGSIALEGKGSRNEKLLPAIDFLLSESGIDRHAIELFAVTRGPGSFTGVRIGLATVQGLALALDRPVCAMSTHEAIALGSHTGITLRAANSRLTIYDDAGRGEFYLSVFDDDREVIAPRLASAAERDELIGGGGAIAIERFLRHGNVAASCARRAVAIAAAGMIDRYRDATPIYVRLAEAEVKLQQKQNG